METPPQRKVVPLSQASGKQKLVMAVPGALFFGAAWRLGFFGAIAQFLTLALLAYALVGVIELLAGESLVRAAKQWDCLASWKKFLIGFAVIVGSAALFIALMPLFAKVFYG